MNEICEKCQAKNSFIEDYVQGNIVCTNCGLVLEENIIDEQYEKRTFETDNKEIKRVSSPTSPGQGAGLGTYIVKMKNGHINKEIIYPEPTGEEEEEDKKIVKNFERIDKLLSSAEVATTIIDRTKAEYRKLAKHKKLNGRNINHVILALYYYVLRKEKIARSFRDVAEMFPSVTEKQIRKTFNGIKEVVVDYVKEDELISMEQNYIKLYTERDASKSKAKELSSIIIKNINNNAVLEGKSPTTVAGLSLLLSYKLRNDNCDDFKTFFSNFASKISLKRVFEQIKNNLDKVIPSDYLKKIDELKLSMDNFLKW